MKEKAFFLPLSYDHTCEGTGSAKRCSALLRKAIEMFPSEEGLEEAQRFVLTGGNDPNRNYAPLAEQMANALSKAMHAGPATIAPAAKWGTIYEIAKGFEEMRKLCPDGLATVYVCTNLGHMPRVLMYMYALKPRGWKIRPVVAWSQAFSWKERLKDEPKKLLLCPGQILLHKLGKI